MAYFNAIKNLQLTGFASASIFLMLLLCGTETVYGQHVNAEPDQSRTGYFLQSGLDILPSPGSGSETTVRIYLVNSHSFTPQLSAGVGLGFTPYNDPLTLIPFFFDFNYRFLEQGITPVLFLRAGYNFAVKHDESFSADDYSGGLLLHPGIGFEVPVSSQIGLFMSAGYNIDNSSYQFQSWGNRTVNNDLSFRRLSVGFGFRIAP